jgi:hypothetical protein
VNRARVNSVFLVQVRKNAGRHQHKYSPLDVRSNTRDGARQRECSQVASEMQGKSGTVGAGISTEGAQEMQKQYSVFSTQYSVLRPGTRDQG